MDSRPAPRAWADFQRIDPIGLAFGPFDPFLKCCCLYRIRLSGCLFPYRRNIFSDPLGSLPISGLVFHRFDFLLFVFNLTKYFRQLVNSFLSGQFLIPASLIGF